MNGTPRGLNRTLLGAFGAILVAAGIAAAWAGTNRGTAQDWTSSGTTAWRQIQEGLAAAPIPGTDTSWWTPAAAALLLVVAALLAAWIAAQGTGRSKQLADAGDQAGSTTVDAAVAAQALKAALAGNPHILSSSVQAWKTRATGGGTGLKISVQARKGASPAEVGSAVEHLVQRLDGLLGMQIPVLVRIKAGKRTRFFRSERVA